MSASLVGSEMCIRDRTYNRRCKPLAAVCSSLQRFAAVCNGLLRGLPGGGPVSYTHLTLPTICSV
eukprot:10630749-Alexandrium_andersonii.AAC.1